MITRDSGFLYLFGAAVISVVLLWGVLYKANKRRNINMRDASLTVEELEEHARSMSLEHSVVSQKKKLNWPMKRMSENFSFIREAYRELNVEVNKKQSLPAAAEWLLDNFYVLEEQVSSLRRDLTQKSYFQLPVLKKGPYEGVTRIFALTMELVGHTHGRIEEDTLLKYLEAYQTHNILFEREIYAIPAMLKLALIENIRIISEEVLETRKQWKLADAAVEKWMAEEYTENEKIEGLFRNSGKAISDAIENANPSFVEHLFYRLRRSGKRYSDVLRYIDKSLDKCDTSTEDIAQKEHDTQAASTLFMGNCFVSLKHLSSMNWTELFDEASNLERILRKDPDNTYNLMDINSRFYYKSTVEKIAKMFSISELYIAKEALSLAQDAKLSERFLKEGDSEDTRTHHIGYYLVDDGLRELENRQQIKLKPFAKFSRILETRQGLIYMFSIVVLTLLLTSSAVRYAIVSASSNTLIYGILAAFAVVIPASEIVIAVVNWIVCRLKKPVVFPRMELKDGIPDSMSTMVVIPAIVPDPKRAKELMENLENHYLGNREKNLYFALIGAFKDSNQETSRGDQDVLNEASERIEELNKKYANGGKDIFYFYNRERMLNEKDSTWTGWERKRGALMEFNELLMGSQDTTFSFRSSEVLPDANIKYVITLDADTVLPLGMAKKMIGTMAHPLNRPVIDAQKGIVIKGYGLMQPRVSFDSDSSNKSLFSRIYTGQEGLDPYASAISDVYQDLFSEGIFTGKGIYDLKVFQMVLNGTLPENAILSHDLLEGSFVRAALVSDLELVDSYPSKYNSFMARLHRWMRGDWQLVPWLFKRVPIKNNILIANPLSDVSKWKITDNLRRSLLAPAVLLLILLGFSLLPGAGIYWFGLGILAMGVSLALSLLTQIFSGGFRSDSIKRHLPGFFGIKASIFQFFLGIIFLPYQAMRALNAIAVTLVRVFITKKNMLAWVTSSDADKAQSNSLQSYIRTMGWSSSTGAIAVILTYYFKPENLALSLILLFLWLSAPVIAYLVSRDDNNQPERLEEKEILELRKITRKTWRYFEEFANLKNNYLAPDNFQEEPYRGISPKTSPTNIGLGLMASLTARDMGYIGTVEMVERVGKTIATVERMEKWNGHLYNWYDTRTLEPLKPMYVSTVDSGNLVCYLTTVVQGLHEYFEKPVIDTAFARGIIDTVKAGLVENEELPVSLTGMRSYEMGNQNVPMKWNRTLEVFLGHQNLSGAVKKEWQLKSEDMARILKQELEKFMPWLSIMDVPGEGFSSAAVKGDFDHLMELMESNASLKELPELTRKMVIQTQHLMDTVRKKGSVSSQAELEWLHEIQVAAKQSIQFLSVFIQQYEQLIARISKLSLETKFKALYNDRRHLFYIGYNVEEMKMTNSYYDLLASEARQTSYLAIARGEVPPKHWSMLGRSLTVIDHFKGLVSWSGTMFEYLMPLLIMRSYKNTLLDETYSFVVKSQIKYGKHRGTPWGSSESAYNVMDINLDYQYKAIGVPWLGLKRGLAEDAVIAPYATILALMVDPKAAYENLVYLKNEGLEGNYGYYEAVDYTSDRLEPHSEKAVVKSFMAHHQGMSLVALDNYLNGDTMQKRFAKDPNIRSARLLLQEKVPIHVLFTKDGKEKIQASKAAVFNDKGSYRRLTAPNLELAKAHVLSNGSYFVGLTDQGTGYSRTRDRDISRWRQNPITGGYGTFFYIQNIEAGQKWSAAYAPLNRAPENYEVVFTADKAAYRRTDGDIETLTEVTVGSGDQAEVRRIKLKNNGESVYTIQVTSYFEPVGTTHSSDLAHPSFSNLFMSTEYDSEHKALLAKRRTRSENEREVWIAAVSVIDGVSVSEIEYETDRSHFIGRGRNVENPEIIEKEKPLSNTVGSVLDPIFSMRTRVRIDTASTARIFFVTVTSDSRESVLELVAKYSNIDTCEASFLLSLTRSQVEAKYLNLKAHDMELYQDMISDIMFNSPRRKNYGQKIRENCKGQPTLWQYGISGDRPIVLLILEKTDEMELLYELLKAHEYWRIKDLKVDLVILCVEENSYKNPLYSLITEIVYNTQTQDLMNRHQDVFILKTSTMTIEEVNLFYANAKIILEGNLGNMEEQYRSYEYRVLPGVIKAGEGNQTTMKTAEGTVYERTIKMPVQKGENDGNK